jgi:hypothetical protein
VLTVSQVSGKRTIDFRSQRAPGGQHENREFNGSTNRLKESQQEGRQNQNL